MTSTAAPLRSRATTRYDRVFYGGMALALGLTVFAGFAPTYYLRLLSGPTATTSGGPFTVLVHLHGALFTAWVLLFVAQTALVASRRVNVHRKLGVAGAVLAGTMVIVGVSLAIRTAASGLGPAGVDPLAFMAIPMFDMAVFSLLVGTALLRRRDRETHKRLMLLGYISLVTAAIARLPGILPLGPIVFFGLSYLFVVVAIAYDYLSRGRVHKAYVWGAALIAVSVPVRLGVSATGAWRSIAEMLTR
ncbi:MAG TPA: hypothetical protein VM032_17170 [Vicinamibacterales bacterium]|nr:hypothetical protein [Vicinamibacterales bacterium]